ncbi:hypothetical protein MANES_16G035175v8 [Manihot esculenta]|uniref:Uncharacterized protein n=1 Tax=Manihot esculenta TaxID=3983 RepID=A0ACB7G5R8_MANES|nr:hypothetical protein MANES_16G035175v8 [Manihot esculenta]
MKSQSLQIFAVLIILLFSRGSEVMGGRICVKPEPLAHCTETICTQFCIRKYGPPPGTVGKCNLPPGFCTCYHNC